MPMRDGLVSPRPSKRPVRETHLGAKLLRDLLSQDDPSPLGADLGTHFHATQRKGLH